MAFADPQSVTINSVAKSMPRIQVADAKSVYQMNDGTWKLTLSHTQTKDRIRTLARLDEKKVVADPLTSVNDYEILSFYFVFERPLYGYSVTEMEQIAAGFCTWLSSGNVDKLFGLET